MDGDARCRQGRGRRARLGLRLPGAEVLGLLARHRRREGLRRVRREARAQGEDASRWGAPDDPGNYMGPVISAGARKSILRLHRGRQAGGPPDRRRRRAAGRRLLRPADHHRRRRRPRPAIFQEEIFGPVLAVTKARDFEHALELANDSQYGLTGAVFSNNPEHREGARAVPRRQPVLQSQVHRRDGRRAPVRRIQYVGHGLEGRRAGLPAAVRAGEVGGDEGRIGGRRRSGRSRRGTFVVRYRAVHPQFRELERADGIDEPAFPLPR